MFRWVIKNSYGSYVDVFTRYYTDCLNNAFLFNTKDEAKKHYSKEVGERIVKVKIDSISEQKKKRKDGGE